METGSDSLHFAFRKKCMRNALLTLVWMTYITCFQGAFVFICKFSNVDLEGFFCCCFFTKWLKLRWDWEGLWIWIFKPWPRFSVGFRCGLWLGPHKIYFDIRFYLPLHSLAILCLSCKIPIKDTVVWGCIVTKCIALYSLEPAQKY